jgi:RecJ-like exonuclease
VEALVEGRPAKIAQCITTTCEKAQTLRAEGYDFVPTSRTGVYECRKPAKVNRKTGEVTEFEPYIVDITAQTCTCIQFERCGVCKHERAIRQAVSEALALLLPQPVAKSLPATKSETCLLCEGSGEVTRWETCAGCEGKGETQIVTGEDRYGYPVWGWQWCGNCDGRGGNETTRRCGHCEGVGEIEVTA